VARKRIEEKPGAGSATGSGGVARESEPGAIDVAAEVVEVAPAAKPARAASRGSNKPGAGRPGAAKPASARRASDADDAPDSRSGGDDEEGHSTIDDPETADGEPVELAGELVDEEATEVDTLDEEKAPASESPASSDGALSRRDPLQAYLREVQRHKLLTPDEEKALTTKYVETQDVRTAARLVTANLRLVVKLAYEYRRAYKNIMDLIQEGNIGLMQAVKRYDPYRGVKLSSYAAWWIRAYILRFILNNWRLVKLGTTQAQRKLFFNLNKEKARLTAMGIDPTPLEIAKRLQVEEKEVVDMDRRLSSAEASLDAPVGESDGRSVSRVELLPAAGAGPESDYADLQMSQLLRERLAAFRTTLAGKDLEIFDRRMVAEDPLTLQELGDEFGVSRERVRQLEARLSQRLRGFLGEQFGEAIRDRD
jgi:RNA polymerase sigma-32 factor